MRNVNSRITKLEKTLGQTEALRPCILFDWMEEEITELKATFGGEFPVTVIIFNIPRNPPLPPRPARPLKELQAEFHRLTRPLPKGWKNARK
jgi:hypothetical protein